MNFSFLGEYILLSSRKCMVDYALSRRKQKKCRIKAKRHKKLTDL